MPEQTLIAVPITRSEPSPAEQAEAAAQAGADLVELRVDQIGDVSKVEAYLRGPRRLPAIITVRSGDEGGAWSGTENERVLLLTRLAELRPDYLDIEYATWERSAELRRRLETLRRGGGAAGTPGIILSHHDYRGTPPDLLSFLDILSAGPGDVLKAVFAPRDVRDACLILAEARRLSRAGRRAVVLALGEAGLLTRVLSKKVGGWMTFASLVMGAESAPGQPTLEELRGLYRWSIIDARTRVYGVIGWPVSHSSSPQLHNAFMKEKGINGVYLPLPVLPAYEALADFLDYVAAAEWLDLSGCSVTIPHKQNAWRWLSERGYPCGESAERCGAVNTLIRCADGGWRGENTDGSGAVAALRSLTELAGDRLRGQSVDILGAGGVARAIIAALEEYGCRVTIYNRDSARAEELARRLDCEWRRWEERGCGTGHVLINCTSVGMTPNCDASPIETARLKPGMVVCETVYQPAETRLLREANARGCVTINGGRMFVGQAAAQMRLWHGQETDESWLAGAWRRSDAPR